MRDALTRRSSRSSTIRRVQQLPESGLTELGRSVELVVVGIDRLGLLLLFMQAVRRFWAGL